MWTFSTPTALTSSTSAPRNAWPRSATNSWPRATALWSSSASRALSERGDFDIFLLAGRYTLLEQEALESFLPLCTARGVGIVIGGPYNSGILATGPRPGAFYNYDPAPQEILDRVARIEAVCRAHGTRMVDAAFQFPLRHPAVVSVIPGGQSADEVQVNLAAAGAAIQPALWADLKAEGLLRPDAPVE